MRFPMNAKRQSASLVAIVAAAVLAACSSSSSTSDDPPQSQPDAGGAAAGKPEIAAFWSAFNAGDYAKADGVAKALDAAATAHPQDAEYAEYAAMGHLFQVTEARQLDPAQAASIQMNGEPLIEKWLGTANKLDPKSFFVTGFLANGLVDSSVFSQMPALETQGLGLIEQTKAGNPVFYNFVKMYETRLLPPDDPAVAAGVEAMWNLFDICIGGTLDRKNPDYTPYLALAKKPDRLRFCWNSVEAPHGLEGLFLHAGDNLVKIGAKDPSAIAVAKIFYKNAQLVDGYSSWPHKDILEARLAATTDLPGRASGYANPNWMMRPPVGSDGVHTCTVCHAGTPPP